MCWRDGLLGLGGGGGGMCAFGKGEWEVGGGETYWTIVKWRIAMLWKDTVVVFNWNTFIHRVTKTENGQWHSLPEPFIQPLQFHFRSAGVELREKCVSHTPFPLSSVPEMLSLCNSKTVACLSYNAKASYPKIIPCWGRFYSW